MTLVLPQGYAHVVHSLLLNNDPEPMAITYGIEIPGPVTSTQLNTIAGALATAFGTLVSGSLPPDYSLVNTDVTYQDSAPPTPPIVASSGTTVAGAGGAGGALPQNCAYLCHKRTNAGGRTGRGRFYLPGVYESQINNVGALDSGTITGMNTRLATFLAAVSAVTNVGDMVLLHDSAGAGAALSPNLITSLTVDPRIATMRRRLRR